MSSVPATDFRLLFESGPDASLVLATDVPRFTIAAVTDGYLRLTRTQREGMVGRSLFEVVPGPATEPFEASVTNLRTGLDRVLRERVAHTMPLYTLGFRRRDGTLEERFWKLSNSPVLDAEGRVLFIVHRVDDVTESIRTERDTEVARRQMAAIVESFTEPFFAVDRDWRLIFVNGYAERDVFRRQRETLIGATLWDVLEGGKASRSGRCYLRAMEERRKLKFETDLAGRRFEIHVQPSHETLSVYFSDVTEPYHAEAVLRGNEARYRSIFDNSMDAVLLTAPDGRIATANRAAAELFGYEEDELRELGRQAVVDLDDPRLERALDERNRTGRFRGELTMKRKDGTRVPVEVSSAVFRSSDSQDGAEWTSMFIRDVSERITREAERERLVAEVDARRRWLEAVLEHVPVGVVLFDANGQVSVNRRTEELFGMQIAPEGGSAQYAGRILFPDGTPVPREQLVSSRVLGTGEPVIGAEFLVERPDGSRVPILGSAAPLRGAEGSVIGAVGVFQDVSERMRAEEEIRSREHLLSGIFELLPVGLWIADSNGKCLRMNPAAVRIWGGHHRGVADYQQARAWWADTGEPLSWDDWPLVRALRGDHVIEKTMRVQTPDGAEKTIVSSALPLFDGIGTLTGACVVKQDISDLKRAEESLKRAVRAREEVMGIVAHDLRSPLAGILAVTQVLRRSRADGGDATAKSIEMIQRQAYRMNRLIQDLLDVARIDSGVLSIEPRRTAVEPLLREVIDAHEATAAAAAIALRIDVDGDPPDACIDRERMLQVFENLVGNAIKFTPSGGVVSLGASSRGSETVFWVTDTGPGVASDLLPHLFDRFWQASRADNRGAGLGLAIVKGIVDAHAGRIWAKSEPGAGTAIYFAVPSASAADEAAPPVHH